MGIILSGSSITGTRWEDKTPKFLSGRSAATKSGTILSITGSGFICGLTYSSGIAQGITITIDGVDVGTFNLDGDTADSFSMLARFNTSLGVYSSDTGAYTTVSYTLD